MKTRDRLLIIDDEANLCRELSLFFRRVQVVFREADEAEAVLSRALGLGRPERYVRVFLDLGEVADSQTVARWHGSTSTPGSVFLMRGSPEGTSGRCQLLRKCRCWQGTLPRRANCSWIASSGSTTCICRASAVSSPCG